MFSYEGEREDLFDFHTWEALYQCSFSEMKSGFDLTPLKFTDSYLRLYLLSCELFPLVWFHLLISFGGFGVSKSPLCSSPLCSSLGWRWNSALAAAKSPWLRATADDAGLSVGRDQSVSAPRWFQEVDDDRRVRYGDKCIHFSILTNWLIG